MNERMPKIAVWNLELFRAKKGLIGLKIGWKGYFWAKMGLMGVK